MGKDKLTVDAYDAIVNVVGAMTAMLKANGKTATPANVVGNISILSYEVIRKLDEHARNEEE